MTNHKPMCTQYRSSSIKSFVKFDMYNNIKMHVGLRKVVRPTIILYYSVRVVFLFSNSVSLIKINSGEAKSSISGA